MTFWNRVLRRKAQIVFKSQLESGEVTYNLSAKEIDFGREAKLGKRIKKGLEFNGVNFYFPNDDLHQKLSKLQAIITWDRKTGRYVLTPLGRMTKTRINGVVIPVNESVPLNNHDTFQFNDIETFQIIY